MTATVSHTRRGRAGADATAGRGGGAGGAEAGQVCTVADSSRHRAVHSAVSPSQEARATRQVREFLAKRYRYNPVDERAVNMNGSGKTTEIADGIKEAAKKLRQRGTARASRGIGVR